MPNLLLARFTSSPPAFLKKWILVCLLPLGGESLQAGSDFLLFLQSDRQLEVAEIIKERREGGREGCMDGCVHHGSRQRTGVDGVYSRLG